MYMIKKYYSNISNLYTLHTLCWRTEKSRQNFYQKNHLKYICKESIFFNAEFATEMTSEMKKNVNLISPK